MAKEGKKGSYGAEQISVLEGLEPVRRRPGMYIGSTGIDGLHHLVWEIFDNSRDEAMAGHANHIEVVLLPGNRIRVADNGRGIPTGIHPKTKVSALETVMTTLHAGGKFGGDESGYKVSGGLHGVGASVVNALSIYTRAEVHREGDIFVQEYSQGNKKANVKKIGKTEHNGTIITFEPDIEIFKEIRFDWKTVIDRLRQQAYLVKALRVTIIDARAVEEKFDPTNTFWFKELGISAPSHTYYFEGGLVSLVAHYNAHQKPIHETIFYCEKEVDNVGVEIALQYVDDITPRITAFANNIYNLEGGTHVTGFKMALTRLINTYAKKNNLAKEADGAFSGDDVLEGLTAVVSVKLAEIQFEGQTKAKLGSTEAQGATATAFGDAFNTFLEEHPDEAKAIVMKVLLALRARKAAKAAKDSILRKGALEGMTLPGKLADCQTKDASEAEVFIVEGDSAGGTAKQGRDRHFQAILPLRGKILNVERARLDKMLASQEIKNLVIAMGTSIGDTFDIARMRYHKLIIATDADVDGSHITTLLLTLFFRYFREVIDAGHVYIALPPLYKIKKGKEIFYAFSDEEKRGIIGNVAMDEVQEVEPGEGAAEGEEGEEAEEKGKTKVPKISVQRYKGLGEMNASELWETTMDPKRRVIKQVTIEDAEEANQTFDMLMGSDVAPRKSFIQSNAKLANLDI
ncbi:MAG TPA: DNA topoisomerase subunit B [Candidatus Paceibacterota bacterium]|nr:DNA topoisomerase subunit B [Candidatus Paceibacterota bacterium]